MIKVKKNKTKLKNLDQQSDSKNLNIDCTLKKKISNDEVIQNFNNDDIISPDDFKSKEKMHYNMLITFYNKISEDEIVLIMDIINGKHLISLRFLDWFVTRYCYLYKTSITVDNNYNKEDNFNINISYKAQLKSFKKKYFDPFRRKKKIWFNFSKKELYILTTLGQLNFFRWVTTKDIIKYCINNYKIIMDKMNYVNSYFKKNLIDNSSYVTSDETNDNNDNDDGSNEINNINDLISNNSNNSNKSKKNIKIKKNASYNPKVSRNICLEF